MQRLAAYWAEVLGGPPAYSDGCGDHSGVLRMHAGNGGSMTDLGERFVRCFDAAADDANLPADPAFRAALHAYMEWAVSDVLRYSPKDAVVPEGAEMPRWGWDGLETLGGVELVAKRERRLHARARRAHLIGEPAVGRHDAHVVRIAAGSDPAHDLVVGGVRSRAAARARPR